MPNTLIYLLDVTFYAIVPYLLWFAMFFFYFLLDLSKNKKISYNFGIYCQILDLYLKFGNTFFSVQIRNPKYKPENKTLKCTIFLPEMYI